jgi:hypothetical protein
MRNIFILILTGSVVLFFINSCNSDRNTEKAEKSWIQLFNGENLDGWTVKFTGSPVGENYNNTFQVEDGKIITSYDEYTDFQGEYGHLFYNTPYSSYRLRLQYRPVGEQVPGGADWAYKNSGVMFHAQAPETMLIGQEFPVCLEAQCLGGDDQGERPTGNLCTPGSHVMMDGALVTDHCINSSSKTYSGDEWINFELIVYADSIVHHVINKDTVITYTNPSVGGDLPKGYPFGEGTPMTSGYIALQAESHPFEFRNIELLELH